ncbi:MAG: ankyrin repeat domain-containing protein [Myxococcota bacterium]
MSPPNTDASYRGRGPWWSSLVLLGAAGVLAAVLSAGGIHGRADAELLGVLVVVMAAVGIGGLVARGCGSKLAGAVTAVLVVGAAGGAAWTQAGERADRADAQKALTRAFAIDDVAGVQAALAVGADPDAQQGRSSLLVVAAGRGSVAMVEALLDAGADPNRAQAGGMTPLVAAVVGGHVETVRRLVEAGADPSADSTYGTPRALAADDPAVTAALR